VTNDCLSGGGHQANDSTYDIAGNNENNLVPGFTFYQIFK